jgi:hypothetical protein
MDKIVIVQLNDLVKTVCNKLLFLKLDFGGLFLSQPIHSPMPSDLHAYYIAHS